MKTLFINIAWDAAGCSFKQAEAINLHTEWKARHFRYVKTFYDHSDIVPENYNKEEFMQLIREADILHFCSIPHVKNLFPNFKGFENWFSFGFDWNELVKDKIKILHDYQSFHGRWSERAEKKDYWDIADKIGYQAVFSSIPQASYIYKDCVYIPDVVNSESEEYTPSESFNTEGIILAHFPTGEPNRKNTNELLEAIKIVKDKYNITVDTRITRDIPHKEIIKLKKESNLGFDAFWRGFHGMTTIENLALGIPTMTSADANFKEVFKEFHKTDFFPFEEVNNTNDIVECIKFYGNNLNELEKRSKLIREFMLNTWNYKNIANKIVQEYEKILDRFGK